ncbi:hypothetical protein PybrP1_010801, partial [[Pythium] brassicae (nom. inval.)]
QGTRISSLEALCLLLRRLSYPNRLKELTLEFERHWTALLSVFNQLVAMLHTKYYRRSLSTVGYSSNRQRGNCGEDPLPEPLTRLHRRHCAANLPPYTPQGTELQRTKTCSCTEISVRGRSRRSCCLDERVDRSEKARRRVASNELLPGRYLYGDPACPLATWLISPVKKASLSHDEANYN